MGISKPKNTKASLISNNDDDNNSVRVGSLAIISTVRSILHAAEFWALRMWIVEILFTGPLIAAAEPD